MPEVKVHIEAGTTAATVSAVRAWLNEHGCGAVNYQTSTTAGGGILLRVERSMLRFAGIKPIRESLYGLAFADDGKRARWIENMRRCGERAD